MIAGIHLISSCEISDKELSDLVEGFSSKNEINSFSNDQILKAGAQLWITRATVDDLGYEEDELDDIKKNLLSEPASCFLIEFNDVPEAMVLALKLSRAMSNTWQLILDDCNGRLYDQQGIDDLIKRGYV